MSTELFISNINNIEKFKVLLETLDPSEDNNYLIGYACENNKTDIVKLLLHDKRIDPGARYNYALRNAGSIEIIGLLMQNPKIDLTEWLNQEILME